MIKGYGDQATHDVHFDRNTKAARSIPKDIWPVCRRKLNRLDAAVSLQDLKGPGGSLEKLKDDLIGHWAIRINDQWRITFKFWDNGTATDVTITDYH